MNILRNFLPFFLVFYFNTAMATNLEATAKLETTPVYCYEEMSLLVSVRWHGEEDDYRIMVPRIALPDGLDRVGVSSKSLRVGETFLIVYACRLAVRDCGEVTVESIEIDYLTKDNDETFTKRIPGLTFVAEKRPSVSTPVSWLVFGVVCAGLVAMISVVAVWSRKRRSSLNRDHTLSDEARRELADRLERCRNLKAHGEVHQFFSESFQLHRDIVNRRPESANSDTAMERFSPLVDQVKYGGAKPHSSETEAYFQALERLVQDVSKGGY